MFISDAPSLIALNGGARLRDSAVRLQHYLDVNPGNKARAVEFWQDQKARAAEDSGHPADGLFIGTGVRDIRTDCYTVLSAVRMGTAADKALYEGFCDFFIAANVPLSFSKNLSGSNTSDADATYVQAGSEYTNSVEVTGGKAPYTYQWYKRSGSVDSEVGTNANTYNIPSYAPGNNGDYFVRVTDAAGTVIESTRDRTRTAVSLSTNLAATATWTEGTAATLRVVAANGRTAYPYTYAWFKDGVATGNTGATLNKSAPTAADAGVYHCVVTSANTNAPNTVESVKCTVTVNPAVPAA